MYILVRHHFQQVELSYISSSTQATMNYSIPQKALGEDYD